jgi:phosphomannomutase
MRRCENAQVSSGIRRATQAKRYFPTILSRSLMANDGLMVSVSGIRGRVGEALTPEVVARYAAGFGAWSKSRGKSEARIVLGRDSRVSGPMFHRVAVAALQSVGCTVIDIGLTTTPTCQLAVEHHHAAGGLMISASHNPIEWNALKFIGSSGLFLEADEGKEMRALVDAGIPRATWDKLGTVTQDDRAVERHLERVLAIPYLDVKGIRARRFKVGLDCVRGAGKVIMPELLERLGCEVVAINLEPDGRFPRPPEPVAENLGELERLVLGSGAAVGFAVDPDVDRLALVSEKGRAIGEDYTLALAARLVLRHRSGAVVTNLSTSRVVDDAVRGSGATVIRAPVGEVNVAVRMREAGAPVGGEGNGGVILSEVHLGRDAPVGAALTLQLLHEENRSLSAIVGDFPRYVIVKDKLDRPDASLESVYTALRTEFSDATADTQDGLRLAWPDRWVHVRPSGTEPIVRVIAEAPTEQDARQLVRRSREPLEKL